MGLDIYLHKVHKNPTMATKEFRIREFPVLQKQFKDYIQIIDIELINWVKTFKCINEKYEDWYWTMTNTVGYEFKHNVRKNRYIMIEHDNTIIYIGTTPVLLVTEEIYQRKNVTKEYYNWLTSKTWEDEDGCSRHTNQIAYKQKDFVKAKEYYLENKMGGVNKLEKMYDALKRKDTFLYNSW